jgi:hypothetical protein
MNGTDLEWKDVFTTFGAFVGLISALITTLGVVAAYKLKRAEKVAITGTPVQILSFKEKRSFRFAAIVKIAAYIVVTITPLLALFVIWSYDLEIAWIIVIIFSAAAIMAVYLFILSKVRGDLSQRRSRTKYETTVTVRASYDVVFAKCSDVILRLKSRIISLDFENGTIESERNSSWHVPFILNVKISRLDPDRCSVYIESDAIIPTALYDFGMNSRRVNRFLQELIQ